MIKQNIPSIYDEIFDDTFPLQRFFAPLYRASTTCVKGHGTGINFYEDEKTVVVEAAVPGVKPENIQVTFDKGGISIEAKNTEEKKDVKYHLRSLSNYSYWIPLPSGKIDDKVEPEATAKDGVLTLVFEKLQASKPTKIHVKSQ